MMAEVLGQPASQLQRLRRNVAAHARHEPGLRVGELSAKQLRALQRGRCGASGATPESDEKQHQE
eukprot:7024191-Lingulodinium_polyedra.AAC.1